MSDPQDSGPDGDAALADAFMRQNAWAGPLPPPHWLRQFDDVVENGAERILRQWERESDHRRAMERAEMQTFARADLLGRLFAFAFVVIALAVTAVAIIVRQPAVAIVLGGTMIGSIVWAFMKTHRHRAAA